MKKRARLMAMLMALVMIVSMFAACGGSEDPATTTEATTAATTEATTAATTQATTTAPALDLTGYNFTIAKGGYVMPKTDAEGNYTNSLQEEYAGLIADLEAKLGITMEVVSLPEGDGVEVLTAAAMGSVKYADLIYDSQNRYWPVGRVNGVIPMDDERLVNAGLDHTDATRWYQPAVKWTAINMNGATHTYGVTVASKYVVAPTGYFVTFNKDICAAAGYDDMYQLARNGEWRWDVYLEIAREATQDLDGDGVPDVWGTGATAWGNEVICNGVQFVGEKDGKWQMTIDSEAGVEALQFLYDMNYAEGTRWDVGSGECRTAFANGTIAFNWSEMGHINGPGQTIYESVHDYGILPMPMGPRATEYYSMTNKVSALFMQSTNSDYEKTVAIMNEWALIANDTESYLDVLDDGRCRTEEDKEMMVEYIIPSLALNLGRISEAIWDQVDDNGEGGGMINEVSYNGGTPQQAIEMYRDLINGELDAFFGQ